jgi:3D (Asp-Asp-Asp) domain-containing protein
LRAWGDGLTIGAAIYGAEVAGIRASKSNVTSVVENITGVTGITRVALETPGNNAVRTLAQDYELLKLGNVVLNNQVD